MSTSLPSQDWESVLREALFNGGCNDVVLPDEKGRRNGTSKAKTGAAGKVTTKIAWPQLSLDVGEMIMHLPVDRINPFGRCLTVSVGGIAARDLKTDSSSSSSSLSSSLLAATQAAAAPTARAESTHATSASTASASIATDVRSTAEVPGLSGRARSRPGSTGRTSSWRTPSSSLSASAPKKVGVQASIAAIGAAWSLGKNPENGPRSSAAPTSSVGSERNAPRSSRTEQRSRLRRGGRGGPGSGAATGGAPVGPVAGGWSSLEERQESVVLDVRNPIIAKVRLVDVGASASAAEDARRTGGGAEDAEPEAEMGPMGGVAGGGTSAIAAGQAQEENDDLEVAELPPPAALVQEVRKYAPGTRRGAVG